MEDITLLFLVLWMMPLLVNSYLLKDEGVATTIMVLMLTAFFSWAVTTILACKIFVQSPTFLGVRQNRFDIGVRPVGDIDEYSLVCDHNIYAVAINVSVKKNDSSFCFKCGRSNRKSDGYCYLCGETLR
ncbi:MAG: hypothetical protein OEM02_14975 [Desulfobulbaceae bacterium]|nr:hypothetical protein [Desulfobulbaceae bacterium]